MRIIFLLSVCLICGCHSRVETHNITASESVRRVFSGKEKTDLMKQYALVLFTTEENGPIRFYLKGSNGEILATATIDKESYAAFFVKPGKYYFQNRSWIKVSAGAIMLLHTSHVTTYRKNTLPYKLFLSKQMTGNSEKIIPADQLIPDLIGDGYRIGYYTGKTIWHTILTPWYILYGTSFVVHHAARGAMESGSPSGLIGGSIFYCLTLWVAKDVEKNTPKPLCYSGEINSKLNTAKRNVPKKQNTDPYPDLKITTSRPNTALEDDPFKPLPNIHDSSPVRENVYGPGIHQDVFGRPVQYHVPGWPSNEPTQHLNVTPNAYGPGIGMDQFGRPVTTRPAF